MFSQDLIINTLFQHHFVKKIPCGFVTNLNNQFIPKLYSMHSVLSHYTLSPGFLLNPMLTFGTKHKIIEPPRKKKWSAGNLFTCVAILKALWNFSTPLCYVEYISFPVGSSTSSAYYLVTEFIMKTTDLRPSRRLFQSLAASSQVPETIVIRQRKRFFFFFK